MRPLALAFLPVILAMPRAAPYVQVRVLDGRYKLTYQDDREKAAAAAKDLQARILKIQSQRGLAAARAAVQQQVLLARKRAGSNAPGSHLDTQHQTRAGEHRWHRMGPTARKLANFAARLRRVRALGPRPEMLKKYMVYLRERERHEQAKPFSKGGSNTGYVTPCQALRDYHFEQIWRWRDRAARLFGQAMARQIHGWGQRKGVQAERLTAGQGAAILLNCMLFALIPRWWLYVRFARALGSSSGLLMLSGPKAFLAVHNAFKAEVASMHAEGINPWKSWPYRTLCFLKNRTKTFTFAKVVCSLAQRAENTWRTVVHEAADSTNAVDISKKTIVTLMREYGFGDFTAYQAAINLSYFVTGLYDPSVHACAADGTLTALRLLYPSIRLTSRQHDAVTALVSDVQDAVGKNAKVLFGKRARDWSLQPAEHSLCAWTRLETGACKRRKRE